MRNFLKRRKVKNLESDFKNGVLIDKLREKLTTSIFFVYLKR